jgi:hypothetical protein
MIEDTFDWYAQDEAGNVWYMGEATTAYDPTTGDPLGTEGSWETGVDGAVPGVVMLADPQIGDKYRQEYYAGEAEDNGAVLAVGQQADVPAGHYDAAVLTADTIALEPDVLEYKLYAEGVGLILALDISGGAGREELVSMNSVDAATARAAGTAPLGTPYD